MGAAVVLLVGAACSADAKPETESNGGSSTSEVGTTTSTVDDTAGSIEFCPQPTDEAIDPPPGDAEAELAQQEGGAAIRALVQRFGDDPQWTGAVWQRKTATVLVRTKGTANALRSEIREFVDVEVEFDEAQYSAAEYRSAGLQAREVLQYNADVVVSGVSIGGGLYHPRAEISVSDPSLAESLATEYGLEQPLDRFCIRVEEPPS